VAIALELGATPDEVRDALLALGLRPNARSTFDPVAYVLARLDRPERGCWVWEGYMHNGTHPAVTIAGVQRYVARILWEHFRAPNPRHLLPTCSEPRCVRPEHREEAPPGKGRRPTRKRVA